MNRLIAETVGLLVLIGAFWWWSAHERAIGEHKIEAKDAAIVAAQVIHNHEVEARAQVIAKSQVDELKVQLAAPPAADAPSLKCVSNGPRSPRPVRQDAGPGPNIATAAQQPSVVSQPDQLTDFGPAIDKRFADDDALIKALQGRVAAEVGICR